MLKTLKTLVIASLLTLPFAHAEEKAMTREKIVSESLRRQVNYIFMGGFIGGVIGLSTLSFYGRPQDKLAIIPAGAAVGLIIGTVYSTSQLVNNPQDFLSEMETQEAPQTGARLENPPPLVMQWTVSF